MKKRIFAFTLIFMVLLFVASSMQIIYYGSQDALSYTDYFDGVLLDDVRNNVVEAVSKAENGELTKQEAFDYITSSENYAERYCLNKDVIAVSVIVFDKNYKELSKYENRGDRNKIVYRELDEELTKLTNDSLYDEYAGSAGCWIDEFTLDGERYFCFTGYVKNGVILAFNDDKFCGEFIGLAAFYAVMGAILYFRSVSLYNKKEKDKFLEETNGAVL